MQAVPRVVSTAADGVSEPREFLLDAFDSPAAAYGMLFLKGYQWPFDARRAETGSSRIDRLVYDECRVRGTARVFDFPAQRQRIRVRCPARRGPHLSDAVRRARARRRSHA
jgi:hypothetical protein